MKINVTVDLEDLFVDHEETVSDAIKGEIIGEVKSQVMKALKDSMLTDFSAQVKQHIENQKETLYNVYLTEFFENEKIKQSHYTSAGMLSCKEFAAEQLKNNFLTESKVRNALDTLVAQLANKLRDELTVRYDTHFAAQLITKMHEGGMLKEDVAKLLLS